MDGEVSNEIAEAHAWSLLREIAFMDIFSRHLKADAWTGDDSNWRQRVMRRIATEENWIGSVCNDVISVWERSICSIASVEDMVSCLAISCPSVSATFLDSLRASFACEV
jgi:hypothetical protein